jgi:hypothetical protein
MTPSDIKDIIKGRAAKPKVETESSDAIKLEVGQQFLGRLTGLFSFDSKYKAGEKVQGWEFETADGTKASITHRGNLVYEIQRSGAEIGDDVLIERLPDEETKNKRMAQTFAVSAYPNDDL